METYVIELDRWNIKNNGTNSFATTKGINDALVWAKSEGYNHIILPGGTYKLKIDSTTFSCIVMQSNMHFEMADGCILQLEANSSPWYRIFEVKGIKNTKISGGKIAGDKNIHIYELGVKFVRGGVNADGSLNNQSNFIRSEIIDRYKDPGLLKSFRLWSISGLAAKVYSFYQYKDTVSASTLAGFRTNVQFAPTESTGRGWFAPIANANKMVFVIDITSTPLSDTQIAQLTATVTSENYTHEWGQGIEITGSNNIEINNVEVCECTGDAISTGWLQYRVNPDEYTQEEMGSHIYINDCDLHHCRRQGITLGGSNDIYIYNNKIHHIGKASDNVSSDFRNGTAPMFGIDIESLVSESNIPYKSPYYGKDGLELNFRIYIYKNYIYNNERGHFVNADGNNITIEDNTFESRNVGGISSYPTNMYVKYLNNIFIRCELWVEGDNFVNGVIGNNANVKLADIRGATIQNVRLKDGIFYGNGSYGYLGTPAVDVENSTFSFKTAHGMGNSAQICFEEWVGKVPAGISVDKVYYVVNRTDYSFRVSEKINGEPVAIYDSGEWGFNVSRYNYGRCYISDVVVERDWNNDSSPGFSPILTGGVMKNVVVKNYNVDIKPFDNYVGRPNIIDGLTIVGAGGNISSCNISDSKFITGTYRDITLGSTQNPYVGVYAESCLFENMGVNLINAVLSNSKFINNCTVYKSDNVLQAMLTNSYLENSKIFLHWLSLQKGVLIAKCLFNNVTTDVSPNTIMIDNLDITNSLADLKAPVVTATPGGGVFSASQKVTLTTNEPANMYYTLDGTTPTTSSALYTGGLTISQSTTLKVLAVDNAGNQSKVKAFRYIIKTAAPADVTNLIVSAVRNSSIDLSWTKSTSKDVVIYDVYKGATLLGSVTGTTYTATGLAPATLYTFTVKAVDKFGVASSGVSVTATTTNDNTPPSDITNLVASSISVNTVGLTWTKSVSSNVQSYEVYQGATLINSVTTPYYIVPGLKAATEYSFTVKTKDLNGNLSSGVNVKVITQTTAANYVTDGLLLYQENPVNNSTILNPDSYFITNKPFTISLTVQCPISSSLLRRFGGSDNKFKIERNTNNQFAAQFWAKNINTGSNDYPSVSSSVYTDETAYYQVVVLRNSANLIMYVNNVEAARYMMGSDKVINESTLPMLLGTSAKTIVFKNIAYYIRALTTAELTQNYNALK
ncbi:chitobiase/beta-hexosaminidase C-terminal domain-containing protein [Bacillus sp. WLY-B-L8]|uniref:chitobiase/beta-hexosaminidase C-terminal domain-containing protein n=1 Tax=Bacillus multifaciens TaxID=3068506 RepID=UPI0027427280|nr:chitobiase/beta-hexosaminidase C-terminal domain-containing protein [Bacillus sp. WLY-B-L8]MDP7979588.1 chitobiase/beta-hexosaminidase C-terminal domain-containing protein [Bacillus sp. WLY-B-L8]